MKDGARGTKAVSPGIILISSIRLYVPAALPVPGRAEVVLDQGGGGAMKGARSAQSRHGVATSLHIRNKANNPPWVRRVAYVAARHLWSLRAALMPAAIRPGAREHTQAISTLSFAHVSFSTAQNATT